MVKWYRVKRLDCWKKESQGRKCTILQVLPMLSELKVEWSESLCSYRKSYVNAKDLSATRQPDLPFVLAKKTAEAQVATGRMALFIVDHTAVMTCDQLSCLCENCFPDSKVTSQIQMKKSTCSGVIKNIWYPHFLADITDAIGNNYCSLLLHESTDMWHKIPWNCYN